MIAATSCVGLSCAAGAEGLRAKEGAMINKSLLTLGTVINKLAEGVQLNGGPLLMFKASPRESYHSSNA